MCRRATQNGKVSVGMVTDDTTGLIQHSELRLVSELLITDA